MPRTLFRLFAASFAVGLLAGCSGEAGSGRGAVVYTEPREPCADFRPTRNLYFGDLHFHSVLSHDAWIFETRSTPEEAYGFARGAPVRLTPLDENGRGTQTLTIDRPLDFAALTEHSEYLGETDLCTTPRSSGYGSLTCVIYRMRNFLSTIAISNQLSFPRPERSKGICGADGTGCLERAKAVWKRIQDAAEAAYDRTASCSFTSFVAYEYTGTTGAVNYHRNVIFRNARVPELPVSYFEGPSPAALWNGLERACMDGVNGCDALAISHNSNESNGNKFFLRYPEGASIEEQRRLAAQRVEREPLVEIVQHKGESECVNGLSGLPDEQDPLCGFEKVTAPPIVDCGDGTGAGGVMGIGCVSRLDYVRNVLLVGLQEEGRLGVNPYKLGIIASTDTHNASPGAVAEDRYAGHLGNEEDTPEKRLSYAGIGGGHEKIRENPGGLTAVWAVENSRDALFDALRKRETYATSGPRISVRFFGGWDYPETMCEDAAAFAGIGYGKGVPMGGDLPRRPTHAAKPRFAVLADRDPDPPERTVAPLQRIQIIKGWIGEDGKPMTKVFEVAGNPNGGGVDTATCETKGAGLDRLCAVWTDPEFGVGERAFYYARVVQNPTCRWSTYECNALAPEKRSPGCDDPEIPKVIQERAWTSPIWYRPE